MRPRARGQSRIELHKPLIYMEKITLLYRRDI